jgi:hypothetical protein
MYLSLRILEIILITLQDDAQSQYMEHINIYIKNPDWDKNVFHMYKKKSHKTSLALLVTISEKYF